MTLTDAEDPEEDYSTRRQVKKEKKRVGGKRLHKNKKSDYQSGKIFLDGEADEDDDDESGNEGGHKI